MENTMLLSLFKSEFQLVNVVVAINFVVFGLIIGAAHWKKQQAGRILALILLIYGLRHALSIFEGTKGIHDAFPHITDLNLPLVFLLPVLYYLYVRSYFSEGGITFKQFRIHFVLPVVITLLYLPFFIQPGAMKLWLLKQRWFDDIRITIGIAGYAIMLIYLIFSIYYLRKCFPHKKQQPLSIAARIRWVKVFYGVLIGVNALLLINMGLMLFRIRHFTWMVYLTHMVSYFVIVYFLIKHSTAPFSQTNTTISNGLKIGEDKLQQLEATLQQVMQQEKAFIDPAFSLADLAERLNIRPSELSAYLKLYKATGFYDLLNKSRVEEAKQLLLDHPQFKVESIGYDVGFNSRSVFYSNFKKYTGVSPAEYRKRMAS